MKVYIETLGCPKNFNDTEVAKGCLCEECDFTLADSPEEADIIRRRYGLDGRLPQTQKQVAALYGISRSYVSRIEKKALGKLEEALRGRI